MSDKPDFFLQWKGTDACLDFNCVCGHHSHIDDYFCYYVRCPNCKRVYELSPQIDSRELSQEEIDKLSMTPKCDGEFANLQNVLEAMVDAGGKIVDYKVDYGDNPNIQQVSVDVEEVKKIVAEKMREGMNHIIGEPNDEAIIGKIAKIFDSDGNDIKLSGLPVVIKAKYNKDSN